MQISLAENYRKYWTGLGISERLVAERGFPLFEEAADLEVAERSPDGRQHSLTPTAAAAWRKMKAAAHKNSIAIYIVSAHRSVTRQTDIISRKLQAGQSLEEILAVNAPPGCSEHHTGRAVDIGTGGSPPLETEFESTPAFQWLLDHAAQYGFHLSFPEGNEWGYRYEPWHWCHSQSGA
ncbi:MAG: M15 family metallopeptidase [Gammaproteobacteria bacterium]